ncbi:MAG: carboxymuconolactone decarboxylase family protein [Verrucomicrobia bacterium]|nr:carboxymuconolactone decarboxylase family protein [Verrucomicrobiota bacterium]MDA1086555.1 carboxymuconolactone decarboxylase family protein [Verrucomicrobiota bacterium]
MTKLLSEEEATGKAKEVLADIKASFGMVPNFFKAQAALDPDWLELNWNRVKTIMVQQRALDRKTKELIALAVSSVNRCEYCSLAHEAMALMNGATEQEITETREVVELFESFNSIADSLRVPCDISPEMAGGSD